MWILPKKLHTSAFVQDMKALGLDSEEFSQICEKSLTWRGKDSLSRTWLRRLNRVNWMKHLSSRTLKHSHTESFVDAWTSSQEASLVSLSQLPESVKQPKTHDTCSHTSETESETANLELFSSKTWKESSQPRQETENQFSNMSSENWKAWVTEQRQEYSQRVKLAHLTRESGSLYWGTPATNDANKTPHCEVNSKQAGLTRSVGRAEANWATPNTMDVLPARSPEKLAEAKKKGGCKNLREEVMHPQNWPTARTSDAEGGRIETEIVDGVFKSKRHKSNQTFGAKLRDAVETQAEAQNWPTATTRDWKDTISTVPPSRANPSKQTLGQRVAHVGLQDQAKLNKSGKPQGSQAWPTPRANKVHPVITEENREQLANRNKANLEEDIAGHCGKATGKLNPDWVEQLMGLPTGWTDFDSSAME